MDERLKPEMGESLKARLKEYGLLIIEYDEEGQRALREHGIDPMLAETHVSPGTPYNVCEIFFRVLRTERMMYSLEKASIYLFEFREESDQFIRCISNDLDLLDRIYAGKEHPMAAPYAIPLDSVSSLAEIVKGGTKGVTGIVGVVRDSLIPSP